MITDHKHAAEKGATSAPYDEMAPKKSEIRTHLGSSAISEGVYKYSLGAASCIVHRAPFSCLVRSSRYLSNAMKRWEEPTAEKKKKKYAEPAEPGQGNESAEELQAFGTPPALPPPRQTV